MKYLYIESNIEKNNQSDSLYLFSGFNLSKNNSKDFRKKIKLKIYNKVILLFKLFIYILLFPLYLSKKSTFKLRKLNLAYLINIELFGQGIYHFTSSRSTISPKYIYHKNKTLVVYHQKTIKFLNNITYNITLEFDLDNVNSVSFKELFSDVIHLTRVDLSKFDKKIDNMSNMFKNCKILEYVNFGHLDTSLVENMSYMFYITNIKFLDLSNFDTTKVTNMEYMFAECNNLLYLNLNNFNTNKVTKMNNMFTNCYKLEYLNLYSFNENSQITLSNIVQGINKDIIYCVNSKNSPKIYESLSRKSNQNFCNHTCFEESIKLLPLKNTCIDNCMNDDLYIYEYDNICYNYKINEENEDESTNIIFESEISVQNTVEVTEKKTYTENNTEKKNEEIFENCEVKDFFEKACHTGDGKLTIETKDYIINNIIDNIISGNLNILLSKIISGESNDYILKEDDVIFQITTTDNQKNIEYDNVSTINLGQCEDILKKKYGINGSLIIFKIDYFMKGLLIPIIGYEVFDPVNKSKLNLS